MTKTKTEIKTDISRDITDNGRQEITGKKVRDILNDEADLAGEIHVVNVNKLNSHSNIYSAISARADVPEDLRTPGLEIIFLTSDGWIKQQFIGSNVSTWNTDEDWETIGPVSVSEDSNSKYLKLKIGNKTHEVVGSQREAVLHNEISRELQDAVADIQPIVVEGDVSNAPDEEDLTTKNNVLKLKDRDFNALLSTGMGYVILRKNKTFAEQILNKQNTIFEIRYDFDLDESLVTIPTNCILRFNGGSLNNGVIIGTKTCIDANIIQIFDDIELHGDWKVNEFHPEWFGAKTNDQTADCTDAINKAIVAAGNSYGGVVKLVQGIYYFDGQINLNHKTSIIGCGIGVSILLQKTCSSNHGIYITSRYGGIKLADFSIRGSYNVKGYYDFGAHFGGGIYIEKRPDVLPNPSQTDKEQKEYAYQQKNDSNDDEFVRGYKYLLIDNVYAGGFYDGLYIGGYNFDVFVAHSTFSENTRFGVVWQTTDSAMHDCYINNNGRNGLYLPDGSGASKFTNLKVVFNGLNSRAWARDSAAISISSGSMNSTFVNCETQDNMCKGWSISGLNNNFIGCWSDTDGHIDDQSHGYRVGYNIYGFVINETEKKSNKFIGCYVTNRDDTTKYDAPVRMNNFYPEIYEGIRIDTHTRRHPFVDPKYINDYSNLTHNIGDGDAILKQEHGTHVASQGEQPDDYKINYLNFVDKTDIRLNCNIATPTGLYIYVALRVDQLARVITSADPEGKRQDIDFGPFIIRLRKTSSGADIRIVIGGVERTIDSTGQSDDYLMTFLAEIKGDAVKIWGVHKDLFKNDYVLYSINLESQIIEGLINKIVVNACINKLVVTQRPIDPTYIIPGSDLSNFRSDAIVYISADAPYFNILNGSRTSGPFANKPTVASNDIPVGYRYFCTDKQTTEGATNGIEIIHKGSDVWVDALGRVISQ